MSFLPAKNSIFLQDKHNNFIRFLVDSGASLSILPRRPTRSRPLARTWWGRMARPFPRGDFAILAFMDKILNSIFYLQLLLVATPLLGMDFWTCFGLTIIPSKQQVLQAASGRTFSKASTSSFLIL
jgi:hypothetical protein